MFVRCCLSCFLLPRVEVFANGIRRFWLHNFFNRLDLVIVPISFVLTIVSVINATASDAGAAACSGTSTGEEVAGGLLISIRILRTLRALRLLRTFDQFFATLAATFMPMKRLLAVMFLFFYFFAVIGMELFAARFEDPRPAIAKANAEKAFWVAAAQQPGASAATVNASKADYPAQFLLSLTAATAKINDSAYGANGYWPVNFDDLFHALVSLFTLVVVNNWPITMEGFEVS